MSSWTTLQHEQYERARRDRLEIALLELNAVTRQIIKDHVSDPTEKDRLLSETDHITNTGLK